MASLRDLKRRIGSVKNTQKTTRAMKLVAGAKLRRATERAHAAKPYQQALGRVLGRVAAAAGDDVDQPLLTSHEEVQKVHVVVFGSDRGLCGSFNNALFREAHRFLAGKQKDGADLTLRTYGKKAAGYFPKRGYEVVEAHRDLDPATYEELAAALATALTAEFEAGEVHEVYLAFNDFKSVMTQEPTFKRILPLSVEGTEPTGDEVEYAYEPGAEQVLDTLLPLYLQTILFQGFLETEAGEHASRMTAMDSATRNAGDLIDALSLQYNRARQAAITKELIEIVSGAAAV